MIPIFMIPKRSQEILLGDPNALASYFVIRNYNEAIVKKPTSLEKRRISMYYLCVE